MNKRIVGAGKELLATKLLEYNGYSIVAKNFRCRLGEVDIIAKKDGYLVFVEVKYRKTIKNGFPMEAVDYKKQNIISLVSDYYRIRYNLPDNAKIRYDVVAILDNTYKIVENAFEHI
ncbi:MAG: YraN family protein [Lachnospiraceae bacterium]|nr:YraN family protein [Lachnospiraceae bacterium]